MVKGQVRPNRTTDPRILDALLLIPREQFVPHAMKGCAYVDEDIEVAAGRYIMEPMVLGRLIEAASILAGDVVLEIGCATGYATAVLARIATTVVAIEEDEALVAAAITNLQAVEADNAVVLKAPLTGGYASEGPYQVIFLAGAAEEVPVAILEQLDENGRILFVRVESGVGHGHMMTKSRGHVSGRDLFDASVPLLPGFEKKKGFVF